MIFAKSARIFILLSFIVFLLFIHGLAICQESTSSADPPLLLRVKIVYEERELTLLAGYHLDVAGINVKEKTIDIIGDRATYINLIASGFTTEIVRDLTPTTEELLALSDYLDPSEVEQRLTQYQTAYPNLAKKIQYATTEEGRPISIMKISDNVTLEEDEPTILFVGQHHAREVMTPEVTMDIIDYLLTNYASDPKVKYWVDNLEIWSAPTHNPDGANYVFTADNMWRKNRKNNGDGSYGVDLNRNYPFKWGSCGGSSGTPSNDTYRGPSPGSEPETQGFMDIGRNNRPVISLSYHTSGELVIHPYGCSNVYPSPHERRVFRDVSSWMAARLINDSNNGYYSNGTAWELLYAVDGDSDGWLYGNAGAIATTIEMNQSFQPDYSTWRDSTVIRNRAGWQYLLDRVDGPSIQGHTKDACTDAALSAALSLDEVAFSNGETQRTSEPDFGRYQWITIPGTFHINFSKDGYHAQKWPVDVRFSPVLRDTLLVPVGSYNLEYYSSRFIDSGGDNDGMIDPGETAEIAVTIYATGDNTSGISATLSSDDPYVSIIDNAASFPDMTAGSTAESIVNHFKFSVSVEAPDEHEIAFTLHFTSNQALCLQEANFTLRITKGFDSCPFLAEYLETNPGWTIENTDANGWEFGPPAGASGGPLSAHTGTNVYGTNLDGNYGNNADYKLTTVAYDMRGLRNAELRFWRWLNNEEGSDIASVGISTNGVDFQEVWKGFGRDKEWEEQRYDISEIADQEETIYIRFRLKSDASATRSGFYIDDVTVCGEEVPSSAGKVKYLSHTIDDSNAIYGNGNGSVDAGETVTMAVTVRNTKDTTTTAVSGILTTASPGVTINNQYAAYPDIPTAGIIESIPPHFTFTVNSGCGSEIVFDFETRFDDGSSTRSQFNVRTGTLATLVVINDNMESAAGWTTEATATKGLWVRQDPYGVNDAQGTPVQPEDDTTVSPGVACWITGNPRPKGNFEPTDGDVDGGYVMLISPSFDGNGAVSLEMSLQRWFYLSKANSTDISYFQIAVSNNGGSSYSQVEKLEGNANIWVNANFDLVGFITPSSNMKICVTVMEELESPWGGDSLVEGLIDDVKITRKRYECSQFTPPSMSAPNPVGDTLRATKKETHVYLEWNIPPADASHDLPTFYRVYRSLAPDAGFVEIGNPTSPFFLDQDALSIGADYYYEVKAENSGGISDE